MHYVRLFMNICNTYLKCYFFSNFLQRNCKNKLMKTTHNWHLLLTQLRMLRFDLVILRCNDDKNPHKDEHVVIPSVSVVFICSWSCRHLSIFYNFPGSVWFLEMEQTLYVVSPSDTVSLACSDFRHHESSNKVFRQICPHFLQLRSQIHV